MFPIKGDVRTPPLPVPMAVGSNGASLIALPSSQSCQPGETEENVGICQMGCFQHLFSK